MNAGDPPPLITECPNCNTRFRVGESQLQMAHGRVRCGACLAVFAGVDHLLLDESAPPPELPTEPDALDSVLAELEVDPVARAPAESDARQSKDVELDWTSVSVDTREFGRGLASEDDSRATTADPVVSVAAGPRASIEEALDNEEALRWWLEDELPDNGSADAVNDAQGDAVQDAMVVQLSHLDAVQDEELDLRSLIESSNDDSSARALEEMFEEEIIEALPVDSSAADLLGDSNRATANKSLQQDGANHTDSYPDRADALERSAVDDDGAWGESSADELQQAIDEAEPLVSRAMANGTIAAAAERMSASQNASEVEAPDQRAKAPVALVRSPHRSASPVVDENRAEAPPTAADAQVGVEGGVEVELEVEKNTASTADAADAIDVSVQTESADPWDSASFPETPAELVEGIAEEMAQAGKPVVEPKPGLWERTRNLLNSFLGHALALRLATMLAFVLLTGQVLYWQFADWSKTATMRPVYAGICSLVGCELPARRSVRDLQSRKLAVRSHPEKPGALLVDALIINEASFEQPFPIIELQFMDMAQQIVGSYRLEPSAYLDGELAGSAALMAVRTPVHIDIDIPDPGPKAVNYQLQFR